jgi:hypothetical protein
VTGFATTRRFRVLWRNGWQPTLVDVDDSTRRFYQGETDFEIAAALACVQKQRDRTLIRDVKEV